MEEKRKDTGAQPAVSSAANAATATPSKASNTGAAEPPSSRRRGQKRKANNTTSGNTSTPPTTSLKRQAREKPLAVPFSPIHNGPCTRARQSPNTPAAVAASAAVASSSAAVVKNEAEAVGAPESGRGEAVKAVEEKSYAAKEDLEVLETKIVAEYEAIRSRDANAHVVPVPSGWFCWTRVHPLEERALPSFFNGKSANRTPEIYMEIRNWVMNKYHANPNRQIESKDLSELSVGELDARREVMDFLDHWGLINYHPFPETDCVMENSDAKGTAMTDSLVEKLYRFETEQSCAPIVSRTNVATPVVPSRFCPESAIAEELVRPEGPNVEYHCNSCSADCSRKRYHCQKQADFDLCIECFNNGKFGSNMSPSDFILMEPAEVPGVSGGKWTDQETLLLLEALELYKENWNEIAEHVATKTKAQCILHFVQMPIEDTFLDCDDETDASSKENVDPVSTNNESSASKGAPETTESKTGANENQPVSSQMEISEPEDASELKVDQGTSENCALKALREAFEAVGSLPTVGGRLSFAEAGNPVMALAAFLLAARHCFVLEDPPDDKKSDDTERAVEETVEQGAQIDESQNDGKQIEEKSNSVSDVNDLSNDHNNLENKDSVTKEKGEVVSPNGECTDKSQASKEPDVIAPHEEVGPVIPNESDNPDLPKERTPTAKEESDDVMSKEDLPPGFVKESGHGASVDGPCQFAEASKDADVVSDSIPSEKKEPEQPVASNSVVEDGANTGEEEAKDCKNENDDHSEAKNDNNFNRIKRAAVTAISAASVKAKLLAGQEEEQIQQLTTLLIEKQLHKLENKLAFFSEMDSMVMRVREQMDRSRQRLFHERAQIIAARLGFSASSSRPMQQSLPANRVATSFANTAPKPPMSMTSQRPPVSRPIMTSGPPTAIPFVPASAAGNSVRPTNQDKLSSVGTK
ncbi:hypothetical protein F0562_028593 [Nyssa sinensis]|uniref:SWI/SNF complex subunit SWI3D n=1 Tax=Nyssa sinensis TaxID=561372 RepID=A0A5J5AYG0_9ASTE|nr:hypothetical protein F0562_028593 [Nyssa sinensis]